jgi:hypothetical protein
VLIVTTAEFGNPVILFILVISNDRLLHNQSGSVTNNLLFDYGRVTGKSAAVREPGCLKKIASPALKISDSRLLLIRPHLSVGL